MEHHFESVMQVGKLRQGGSKMAPVHFHGLLESEAEEPDLLNVRLGLYDE